MVIKNERIGSTSVNRHGTSMTVIDYQGTKNVTVQFPNGYTVNTSWQAFSKGSVKNPYDKTIFGIGYLGEGKYLSKNRGKVTKQYDVWRSMLTRAYSKEFHERQTSYELCSVAKEWHNFQTFAKWFDDNYYEIDGERLELDKDILCKGNKQYSPSTCIFVPASINKLFIKVDKSRGEQPVGVYHKKGTGKYYASVRKNGRSVFLGSYETQKEAFMAYKEAKELNIQEVADEYKDYIPTELYEALINYEVHIND
ncbi:hypothetical protein Goe5_c01940 [Bacillus phage vB_BthM-Goe5]|nr:hypothetical protein Goe5_c01940 [Bacillus phage vB_BthM-Goe5]